MNNVTASVPHWHLQFATSSALVGRPSLLHGFRDEFEFALSDNWDGGGAKAVSKNVLRLAERLIEQYATLANLVEIAPGRDGSLSFTWDDNKGNYIYLDVGPNDAVHVFYDVSGQPKWEGVSVANDPRILRHLDRAFAFARPRLVPAPRFFRQPASNVGYRVPVPA